jgi:hypothetical protein
MATSIIQKTETPDTVHGRLLESVHVSGYTFERACGELEWLLDGHRWKKIGRGYKHIDEFLATLKFSDFRIAIDQRKKLSRRLAELGAGQSATSRLIGASEATIARDKGKSRGATNVAKDEAAAPSDATNVGWFQSDIDPTREAKRITNREQQAEERATARAAAATAAQAAIVDVDAAIQHAPFTTTAQQLADNSVPLIFTDPPYHDKTLPIYTDLGIVAARVLQDGGSLITYTAHHRVPETIAMLQAAGLTFFWPLAVVYTSGNLARMTEYGIIVHWKPLLWFVKGAFRSRDDLRFVHDVIESPKAEKTHHAWQQEIASARYYIETLTQPGDLVFDPFCGGGTTATAAKIAHRRYLTCDVDEQAVWIARQRVQDSR